MKIAVSQPRYLPAVSYLNKIYESDTFVLLDDVQFNSRGFDHRNKLVTPDKSKKFLTIPLEKFKRQTAIKDLRIRYDFRGEHKRIVAEWYRGAKHFSIGVLDRLYSFDVSESYVDTVESYLRVVCGILDIDSRHIFRSSEIGVDGRSTAKLTGIVNRLGGDTYLSGPGGLMYMNRDDATCPVEFTVFDFSGLEKYRSVGFVDMLFNEGIEFVAEAVKRKSIKEDEWR